MTDYYAQIRKGGAWHRLSDYVPTGRATSICGDDLGWWATRDAKTEPSGSVCKRCERIAGKEKKG